MSRTPRPRKKTVVRYYLKGKRCPKSTPGAQPRKEKSRTWYAWLSDRWVPLRTTDEAAAWQELRRLQRQKADPDVGQSADDLRDHARTDLEKHVAAWLADVEAGGASADHAGKLRDDLRILSAEAGWKRLADITSSSCLQALARVVKARGLAPQTRNHYLGHVKQFTRWAAGRGQRLARDPLAGLEKVPIETDLRHARRRPTNEEMTLLFAWLALPAADIERFKHVFGSGKHQWYRCKMTGKQRRMGYRVAMGTGLRAQELRSLMRDSFDLDAGTVTLRAAYDKRRRKVVQPLPQWLWDELREYFASGGECWAAMPAKKAGYVLQFDLEQAGVPYSIDTPDGPLFFDMHALRHWFCSQTADDPTVSLKQLQELCRHKSAELTLRLYAHARREDVTAAARRQPPPPG